MNGAVYAFIAACAHAIWSASTPRPHPRRLGNARLMHADIDISAVQQLPVAWADGLRRQHANPSDRGRAVAADAWSIEEHAQLLLQYKRPGVKVALNQGHTFVRITN